MTKFSLTLPAHPSRLWHVLQELSAYTDRELHDIVDGPTFTRSPAWRRRKTRSINGGRLTAPPCFTFGVDVVDADDVVLAEIAAGLNLNQLNVDLAGLARRWVEPIGK